ncbi:MAG: hypothetical protein FWF76_05050 [Oscillospiraceae bacterium]|nr:hypothetical protein [Oscillospiraceae bacterium]
MKKKITASFLCLALAATIAIFTACGDSEGNDDSGSNVDPNGTNGNATESGGNDTGTDGGSENNPPAYVERTTLGAMDGYFFHFKDFDIFLGSCIEIARDRLGEPNDYFAEESCAFHGRDYTYFYPGFEISTFSTDETGEDNRILAINVTNDTITTPNGAYIGASRERVLELYGEPSEIAGTNNRYRYFRDGMSLEFKLTDGVVDEIFYHYDASDEYRIDL